MSIKHGQHVKEVHRGEVIARPGILPFHIQRHGWIWWDECGQLGEAKVYRSPQAAERALAIYYRDVLGHDVQIPPKHRSPASKLPSILVRFPTQKDRERVKRAAERADMSVNAYCVMKLVGIVRGFVVGENKHG